jgi:CrcB protein
MMDLVWVTLGCFAGGIARYFVSGLVARHFGETFPWGTLIINVSGGFAIGLFAASANADGLFAHISVWRVGVVGFLGAYTTVSSFSIQTLMLLRHGEMPRALGNIVGSLCLCLAAAALGILAGGSMFGQS